MTVIIGKYIPWFPVKETIGEYQILNFEYTFEGLVMNLSKCNSNGDIKLKVYFPGNNVICRILNETYRGKLNRNFTKIFKDIGPSGPLFKVENSEYMKMLSEESDELTDMLHFKHYAIEDSEWSFDVASQYQPQIELFINGKLVEKLESVWHAKVKEDKT